MVGVLFSSEKKTKATPIRFRANNFLTSPFLAHDDPNHDQRLEPLDFISRIADGETFSYGDDQAELIKAFRNASKLNTHLRPELAEAVSAVASLYGWGARLNDADVTRMERIIGPLTREEVIALTADDPWIQNFLVNVWEYVHGVEELTSYPWNISLPIADLCNARCIFCTSWIEGTSLVKLEQIEAFANVIAKAIYIGLVGHGEPMAHPKFDEICRVIAKHKDPRAATYTITNGVFLKKWADLIDQINVRSYSISLNAASAATHETVMGLGPDAFDQVTDSLRSIIAKNKPGDMRDIGITMVITQQNVHEVADFVRLGNDIGVTQIWLRSLLPQANLTPGLNYHTLSPSLHPKYEFHKAEAVAAIAESKVPVQAYPEMWDAEVFSPKLQSEINRNPPPIISREAALKDKALRKRTHHVYDTKASKRRGRVKRTDEYTNVEYFDNKARITTISSQWAYAIKAPLNISPNALGEGRLSITLESVSGEIGLGILDADANEWLAREFVRTSDQQNIQLTFPGDRPNMQLIVENASDAGKASHVTIKFPLVEIPSSGWSSQLNLTESAINNPVDPYEDGENSLNRQPRFACKAPYYNLYVNEMFFRVVPCCYMTEVPGFEEIRFDGSIPFDEAWNSPALKSLRARLNNGPLYAACRKCPEKW